MSRQTTEFAINGVTYTVTQLGTGRGVALGHRLVKGVGPAVLKFFDKANSELFARVLAALAPEAEGANKAPKLTPQDVAAVGSMVSDAVFSLDEKLRADLEEAFKETTFYKDESSPGRLPLKINYDDHFAGQYGAWLKWFVTCARFNYIGFFPSTGS